MTMLVRRRAVFQLLQRAFRNTHGQSNSISLRPPSQALVELQLESARHFSAATSNFQTAAPKAREADDVSGSKRASSFAEAIDKLLHSVSLNVQRTGRVYVTDIIQAKHLITKMGSCSPSHALLLLRCGGELCVDEKVDERVEMVDSLWNLFKNLQVPLDVSHYNALLRTYVENDRQFSPTEFLSMMESENGIEPNRVTYQFLIARYCNVGDILGATTILEHMKERDMTVNEHVFHSLIIGHCRNGDFESAEGILKMMSESGIDVGSEAHVSLLRGMGRAGKSWEEISEKITEANNANVSLTDHDLFRIAIELIRAKNLEGARQAVNSVPKSRGFFQEMRNAVPQMIFAGDVDLAFDTLKGFKTPTISDESHKDASSKDHGLFFLRAMVKSEYSPEKVCEILEIVVKENGDVSNYASRLVELCVDMEKLEYGSKLADHLREKFGNDLFNPVNFTGFFRSRAKRFNSEDEVISAMKIFDSMKIQLSPSSISNDVMPILFKESNVLEPLKQLNKIIDRFDDEGRANKRKFFINCLIQYLLNIEKVDGLYAVSRMSLFTSVPARPSLWSASLARSYLAVGDINLLTTILFNLNDHVQAIRREKEVAVVSDQELFSTLVLMHGLAHRYRPLEGPDEVVMNVLNEMKHLKLGIPEHIAELLRPAMEKTESSGELLDEMVQLYKDRTIHLSKDRVEKILNEQRINLNNQLDSLLQKNDQKRTKRDPEAPRTTQDLERLQQKLISSNVPAARVSLDLINSHIDEGNLDKVSASIENIIKQNPDFHIPAISIAMIINKLIEQGKVDDAVKLLKNTEETTLSSTIARSKKFIASYTTVGIELAKAGKDDEVISLLDSINPDDVMPGMLMSNVSGIIVQYGSEKRSDMAQKVADRLLEKNLVDKAGHISPLITAYLNSEDVEGAVTAFESLSKKLKKLPGKTELMEHLIQKEDMERMQRVLDASISVIGEERSLYDLAMNFLSLGKTSQARKLLETPGLRYNHDKVTFICKYFVENNMLTALENFVFLSQSVFNCDREFMFTTLAQAYSKNSTKMHEVWVRMQEDGFVPSDRLKGIMAAPFVAEEKPIPFHVPPEELQKAEVRKQKRTELPEGAPSLKERYAVFDTAIANDDLSTSILEFLSIAESGTYITTAKVRSILELCCKKSAWKEASSCIKATMKRDLQGHLSKSSKAVKQVLDNLGERDFKVINELFTDEKMRDLFDMEVRMRQITKQ